MTELQWTPFPGHYPGQDKEDWFYAYAEYKGMHVEVREYEPDRYSYKWWDPAREDEMDLPIDMDDNYFSVEDAAHDAVQTIDWDLSERGLA